MPAASAASMIVWPASAVISTPSMKVSLIRLIALKSLSKMWDRRLARLRAPSMADWMSKVARIPSSGLTTAE
jgi:hypothetical protein